MKFKGSGSNEVAVVADSSSSKYKFKKGQEVLAIDTSYYRPTEVDVLIGDATKAKEKLGWVPEKSLDELVKEMMNSDLEKIRKIKYLENGGYDSLNHFK